MLVELAVCDSYGAGFEFNDKYLQYNDVTRYVWHPTHGLKEGQYTDDTQRTIGNVLAILDDDLSRENLARRYVEVFKRDPRKGYARGYQAFLESVTGTEDYLARIKPDSDRSGACMSVAVFGLYPTLHAVTRHATQQAIVTHNTTDGINAACAVAAAAWYMRKREGRLIDLGDWLQDHIDGGWAQNWAKPKVNVKAMDCALAAIYVVRTSHSMKEIMRRSVALTGDTDTVAAIAGAIGSLSEDIEQDIPQVLFDTLENGPYGRDYLADLDRQLRNHLKA